MANAVPPGLLPGTLEFHLTLANNWMRMKTATFSQMQGPLTRNVI
jgi:hypothetical protein